MLLIKQGDKARVIQTLLFVAGINTLLQTLFGTRLPAVVGGSFAYVIPIAYIINDSSLQKINEPHVVSTKYHLFCFLIILIPHFLSPNVLRSCHCGHHAISFISTNALQRFIQTMRAIQGALIVAASIQIILGYSQVWGLFSRYIVDSQMLERWNKQVPLQCEKVFIFRI